MAQIAVHVHAGARRGALEGWRPDGALKLAVTAPPERGRANRAVATLLAGALGVAERRISVVRGWSSRSKRVEVSGMEEPEIRRRIEEALASRERPLDD